MNAKKNIPLKYKTFFTDKANMNSIPRIDVFSLTRSNLKALKVKGSLGGQTESLVNKSNEIARAGLGNSETIGHSLTVTPNIARKLNII